MQLRFASLFPWWIVISIAVIGGVIIALWYWRESNQIGNRPGLLLAVLRGIVFFLLMAMLLRPSVEYSQIEGELSKVRVIIDTSTSMRIQDEVSPEDAQTLISRIDRVHQGLLSTKPGQESLLARLAQQHRIEVVDLEGRVYWSSDLGITNLDNLNILADKSLSPIGEALLAQAREASVANEESANASKDRSPPDAVVLISDGQSNGAIEPLDVVSQVSNTSLPIYTVAVGRNLEPDDLGILSAQFSSTVRREDLIRGTLRLKEQCPDGTSYRLLIKNGGVIVYEQNFTSLDRGIREVAVEFSAAEAFGLAESRVVGDKQQRRSIPIDLECSIEANDRFEELTLVNNRWLSSTWGTTRENRILVLDPRGRWETRYVRNALDRDPSWELESRLGSSDFEKETTFVNKESLLPFDLVILTSEAARTLKDEQTRWISDFVSKSGGGLIWIDSMRATREASDRNSVRANQSDSWRALLPIRSDDDQGFIQPGKANEGQSHLRLSNAGKREPALQLNPMDSKESTSKERALTESVWDGLERPRSAAVHIPKPGSEVLIEFLANMKPTRGGVPIEDWYPLMTTSRFGQGRVIALASDETWRWRFDVADLYHQRFWNQIATWCMRPPFAISDDYLSIDAGSRVYQITEPVVLRTKLLDDKQRPLENGSVRAVLEQSGVPLARVELVEQQDSGGVYRGEYSDLSRLIQSDRYDPNSEVIVRIEASGVPLEALKPQTSFLIDQSLDLESTRLACNEEKLTGVTGSSLLSR
ncbi:hypothetical protein SH449x_002933 [Pirellulaceae bacterium SH449]